MKKRIVKNIFYSIIFSLCWSIVVTAQANQAVTYFGRYGRFGDGVLYYTVIKFISYKYNMPLFLKPFKYSSMLRLGREEKKYSREIEEQFKGGIIPFSKEEDIIVHAKDNVIFANRNFRIDGCSNLIQTIEHMLQDQCFMSELKSMLKPVVPLPKIALPQDKITVAVHIRKGGGFDPPLGSIQYYNMANKKLYADKRWPSKFPPEQYYVDQIKKMLMLFDDEPLFLYIFTDDRNPSRLVARIKKAVNKNNITFSCRSRGNAHNAHVVEDFYNMSRFDCLIRSNSHFGIAAQLLGNHKIIIYPKHFKWVGRKLIVDEVTIVDNRVG